MRIAVPECAASPTRASQRAPARASWLRRRRGNSSPSVDVVERAAPRHQRVGLEHVAGSRVDAGKRLAERAHFARRRCEQSGRDVEQRRFAAAGRARRPTRIRRRRRPASCRSPPCSVLPALHRRRRTCTRDIATARARRAATALLAIFLHALSARSCCRTSSRDRSSRPARSARTNSAPCRRSSRPPSRRARPANSLPCSSAARPCTSPDRRRNIRPARSRPLSSGRAFCSHRSARTIALTTACAVFGFFFTQSTGA